MEHRDRLWPGGYTFLYDDGLFRPSTDTFLLGAFPRLRRGMTVCELGAGTGLLSLLLLAREPELTVTGVELQPQACALFRYVHPRSVFQEQFLQLHVLPDQNRIIRQLPVSHR